MYIAALVIMESSIYFLPDLMENRVEREITQI